MTIVVTGGGSGGHITPLLAVAAELKKQKNVKIVYIGQRGDRFAHIVSESGYIDETKYIFAGKLRRYHGEGWRQLLDVKTLLLNIRDMLFVGMGCMQSVWLLWRTKPAVVFVKGGFVGVPVGLSAALWRIPYVTHDSDAIAGLANRIIAKWARKHAVALPEDTYDYPKVKTITVGVPIAEEYNLVTGAAQTKYKQMLAINAEEPLLLVTGGGLGAKKINDAMVTISARLFEAYPTLHIVHTAGHAHSHTLSEAYAQQLAPEKFKRVTIKDYLNNMYQYSGAADVVVARAGATNMAELAAQGKACVVVPNPVLAGGHQLKNAEAYEDAGAVILVHQSDLDADSKALFDAIEGLLGSKERRAALGARLHAFAHADAAEKLAMVLLEQANYKNK